MFIKDRDFYSKRVMIDNYKGYDYIIAEDHFEDPEFPPVKKAVRATINLSGYLIKKEGSLTTIVGV